jgi:hypothetical protein
VPALRGPMPERNNKPAALRACGYKPTGYGAVSKKCFSDLNLGLICIVEAKNTVKQTLEW